MNARAATALAFALAIALGAIGYAVGIRSAGVDRAGIEAMIKDIVVATAPAPIASTAPAAATVKTDTVQTAGLSDEQRTDVESTIRNYLIANPEIIRDAINALQRKEDEAAQQAQAEVITENADMLFNSSREVVLGNPKGNVTLVEFFDYNCAYCRRAHADMKELIAKDPNLRVVLKEFPILGQGSVEAAQIAVAVLLTAPDKYGDFHSAMLSEKGQVDGARAIAVAEELGLDTEALKVKANSDEVKANITEVHDLAEKLDLTGTPSYATKLKVVVGAIGYDGLKAEIDKVRAQCAATASC